MHPSPNQDYRDDNEIQIVIHNLFVGTAPERAIELEKLWQILAPKFRLMGDGVERFVMDAGAYRYVRFNHRAVRSFWLAGYVAWEGYRAVIESFPLDAADLRRFTTLISAFDSVISSDAPDLEPLPSGVAEPGTYPDKHTDPQGRAAAELATLAVGWALLHELRHIQHQQECSSANQDDPDPTERHREEMSCDLYATQFLLDQVDTYAQRENVDPNEVRQKRQLGIYFALFALTLLGKDKWGDSRTHPSIQRRIDAIHAALPSQGLELSGVVAFMAFAALKKIWPNAPGLFNI